VTAYVALHNAFPGLRERLRLAEERAEAADRTLEGTQRDVLTLKQMVEYNAAQRDKSDDSNDEALTKIAQAINTIRELQAERDEAVKRAEAAEKDAEIARGSRSEIMAQYEQLTKLCRATEERERGYAATVNVLREKVTEFLNQIRVCHIGCEHNEQADGVCLGIMTQRQYFELDSVLAATPAQNLGRVKAAALRHFSDHITNIIKATSGVSHHEWLSALRSCRAEAETMADAISSTSSQSLGRVRAAAAKAALVRYEKWVDWNEASPRTRSEWPDGLPRIPESHCMLSTLIAEYDAIEAGEGA
jgi:FtsZ-binding cell division protein ZapB